MTKYTIKEFFEDVKNGFLIDYDGAGHLANDEGESNIQVVPSDIQNRPEIFNGFKYVHWYNK